MQYSNYEYLTDQLAQIGYNENLQLGLLSQMIKDPSQFSIKHKTYFDQDIVSVSMQFERSQESKDYHFKNYTIEIEKRNNTEAVKQIFQVEGQDIVTLKEAYNLLQGRAVLKDLNTPEGVKCTAWIQLDYKNTDKDGSFSLKIIYQKNAGDLVASLEKLAVIELKDLEKRKQLVKSLEGGNRQSVTYLQGNVETKLFIEAVPQFAALHIYDADMKRMNLASLLNERETTNLNQTYKNQLKLDVPDRNKQFSRQLKSNRM